MPRSLVLRLAVLTLASLAACSPARPPATAPFAVCSPSGETCVGCFAPPAADASTCELCVGDACTSVHADDVACIESTCATCGAHDDVAACTVTWPGGGRCRVACDSQGCVHGCD